MSDWEPDDEVLQLIRKYALQNALEYDGDGQVKSVQGRVLGENAELREHARHLVPLIGPMVDEANELWKTSGADAIRSILEEESPDALEKRTKERREGLPELPNAKSGEVVLRFAPNPNGPLSLGHSRGVMINGEYAATYDGKLILRFDDTDTKNKQTCERTTGYWTNSSGSPATSREPSSTPPTGWKHTCRKPLSASQKVISTSAPAQHLSSKNSERRSRTAPAGTLPKRNRTNGGRRCSTPKVAGVRAMRSSE